MSTAGEVSGPRPIGMFMAGLGGGVAILVLTIIHDWTHVAVLVPSMGASCALVFGVPDSPYSRPQNVIGGHLVSAGIGLLALAVLGAGPAAMSVGVGCAIAAMMATRSMHPPAGGDPLIVIMMGAQPDFLLSPIFAGAVAIVTIGAVYRPIALHVEQSTKRSTKKDT